MDKFGRHGLACKYSYGRKAKHDTINDLIKRALLMSLLREKFWIIRARTTIKKIVKECFVCNWYQAKPFTTPPAQLPIERITDAATFEVTGVDLTGHLFLEDGSKVWVVLYTCAVYRAIVLDVVTSLTTDAFMQSQASHSKIRLLIKELRRIFQKIRRK